MPHIVAMQRLVKHIPASTDTHETIEELLQASFSMRFVSYKKKLGDHNNCAGEAQQQFSSQALNSSNSL
jgi:hypothetical protein